MAKVRVEVLSAFAETLGMPSESEETIPDQTGGDGRSAKALVERLLMKYPNLSDMMLDANTHQPSGAIVLFHNGRDLELSNGLDTMLNDGDTVTLVPFIAGG